MGGGISIMFLNEVDCVKSKSCVLFFISLVFTTFSLALLHMVNVFNKFDLAAPVI